MVVSVAVLALIVAGITVARTSGSYDATASILVTPLPEGDASFVGIGTVVDTGDPARTMQTAAALVDTPNAAAAAAHALGAPWTQDSVRNAVSVSPLGASNVLNVSASASSPAGAQRLANAFAEKAIAYRAGVVQQQIQASISQLQARIAALGPTARNSAEAQAMASSLVQLQAVRGSREPTMSISQTAELPTSRSGVSRSLLLLIALAAGLIIGCIAAIAIDAFSRPVQDPEEIRSIYPLPVLARIPDVGGPLRARGDTPPWTLPPFAFEQFRMLRVQLSVLANDPVIMVTSAGAGDGKTTVAAALAAAFGEAGRKVMLMDLDLRKPSLAPLLGVHDVPGRPGDGAKDEFGSLPVERLSGVRVLPPPLADLTDLDSLMAGLPAMLERIREESGVVIIDTSPVGEVSEALQLARISDHVLFVARPRHTDRRRLGHARDLLRRAGVKVVGLVLVGKGVDLPGHSQGYGYAYSLPHAQPEPVAGRPAGGRSRVRQG